MSEQKATPFATHVLIGLDPRARTDALLSRYRAALRIGQQERRFANTLWLAPTHEAVREVTDRLMEEGAVVFAPRVMTFDGFAEWILETLAGHITPVSPALRRTLLREIVDRLVRDGTLRLFRSIASTSGFLDLVEAFIADLKRDEVWPDVYLQKLGEARLAGPRDHELAGIYQAYQLALQRGSLFDNEGRFWSARQALAARGLDFLGRLDLVVVDGFSDFTATQHDLLADIAGVAGDMWVSLPLPPEAADDVGDNAVWKSNGLRGDLFALPGETLKRLRGRGAVSVEVARGGHPVGAIDHITRNLFGDVRATSLSSDGAGLEFHAVAGAAAELKACVTGVKRWLLEGVPPAEIVVVCRAAEASSRLLEQFADAGVPVAGGSGGALSRSPRIKLLLGLLQLEAEDWRFERLSGVLNSSLLRPQWPSWDADESPRVATRFLRDEQLPVGARAIVRGAERLLSLGVKQPLAGTHSSPDSEGGTDTAQERYERYLAGAKTLLELDRALHPIRGEYTFSNWLEQLPALAREFGLEPTPEDRRIARDEGASWDLFERTLFALARGARRWLEAERLLSLKEFLARLEDWLDREPSAVEASAVGTVRILSPNQGRHVDARRVWIVGLSETSYPGTGGEDCLFSDGDRRTFHGLGLSLRPREHRIREEMLLFWSLLPRARERLVLGYPLTNADGEPLSPSPFLEQVRDLFEETARNDHFDGRLDPLPDPDALISSADMRVHAARMALEGDGRLFAGWASSPARFRTAAQIAGGLDLLVSRFHERGFGPFEGRVESDAALEWVARRFDAEHEFNATELESYATCPFRFAMTRIAGVRPPPDPVPGQDVAARGSLVHEVLAEVHRQLLGGKTLADVLEGSTSARDERLVDRFRELVEERLGRRERPGELQAALLRIEGRLLRDWGEAYQSQWSRYGEGTREGFDVPPVPALFEAAFGTTGAGAGGDVDGTRTAALIVGSGAQAVRIGGRIDRLDVGRRDGRTVYVVIDYKTGGDRRFKEGDLRTGRQLQLVLYALAVQRLGLLGESSLPLQFGYWNLREQGFSHGLGKAARGSNRLPALDEAAWQSLVELLEGVVPKLAQGMRRGEFPVFNSDKTCTSRCELSKTCRVAEIRALPPGMARHWSRGVPADASTTAGREGP